MTIVADWGKSRDGGGVRRGNARRGLLHFSVPLLAGLLLAGCGTPEARRALIEPPPAGGGSAIQSIKAAPTPMDSFRALAPPEGMKFTPLFTPPLKDTDERIQRVEDAVQTLRNDFDTVVPSLVRLVAVEKDMKDLIGQLKAITGDEAAPPVPVAPVQQSDLPPDAAAATAEAVATGTPVPVLAPTAAAPASRPAAPVVATASPSSVSAPLSADIRDFNISDGTGRTRVIVDLSARPIYSASIQDNGRRLVIDLPRARWAGKAVAAESSALVSSYRHEDRKFHVDLKFPAKIAAEEVVQAEKGFRLIIDLVSPDVHK